MDGGGPAFGWRRLGGTLALGEEDDALDLGGGGPQRGSDRRGVAAFDPGARGLRGGEVEGVPLSADGPQRLDPELKGGGWEVSPKLLPDALPDGGEIVGEGFRGHGARS